MIFKHQETIKRKKRGKKLENSISYNKIISIKYKFCHILFFQLPKKSLFFIYKKAFWIFHLTYLYIVKLIFIYENSILVQLMVDLLAIQYFAHTLFFQRNICLDKAFISPPTNRTCTSKKFIKNHIQFCALFARTVI